MKRAQKEYSLGRMDSRSWRERNTVGNEVELTTGAKQAWLGRPLQGYCFYLNNNERPLKDLS